MNNLNAAAWAFFIPKPFKLLPAHERWRRVAKILKLSREARLRLEWIIDYHEGRNATEIAHRYGISRKTFYKWFREFDSDNLYSLFKLEDRSKAPKRVRQREITSFEEERVIQLRKRYIRYGKEKLSRIYENEYQEKISTWKIQRVIETYRLYYNPQKTEKLKKRKQRARRKKRITELKLDKFNWRRKKAGYIICLDTITIHWNSFKRYIFTAIDKYGKVAYARMYKNKSSKNGEEFLLRLYFLLDGKIPRVGHDNGSEFEKCFRAACEKLNIQQYYSRVRTPKDNPDNERFNRTLQEEFIRLGNFTPDLPVFNQRLTEWLVEYNFHRPHATLHYQTPMKFSDLSPMYSSCTLA